MVGLFERSALAAGLILCIAVLRAILLNKIPKITFQVMWAVAILRLLIPFSLMLSSHWCSINVFSIWPESDAAKESLEENENMAGYAQGKNAREKENFAENQAAAELRKQESAKKEGIVKTIGTKELQRLIWLAGMLLLLSYFVLSHIRCRRRYAAAIPIELPEMGLAAFTKRRIQIKVSDRVLSPLTYGVFSPVILLPKRLDWERKDQLRIMLAHEAVHIRRWDVLYKWIMIFAVCLHWFNPFAWIMLLLAGRDIELSCDEAVMKQMRGNGRAKYAMTLLCFEEYRSISAGFNKFGGNAVKERMEAIMKFHKKSAVSTALAALLIAGTTTVFATAKDLGKKTPASVNHSEEPYQENKSGQTEAVKQYLCEPLYYTPEEYEENVLLPMRKEIEEQVGEGNLLREDADKMLLDLEDTWRKVQAGRKIEKPSPVYHADGTPVQNSRGEQLYVKASEIKRMNEEIREKARINAKMTAEEEKDIVLAGMYDPAKKAEAMEGGAAERTWYTYEEFAEYVKQQKEEYAGMLGEFGYHSMDGWYEWTEEKIAEACRLLDEALEFIKGGGVISKPTFWEEDGSQMGELIMGYSAENLETALDERVFAEGFVLDDVLSPKTAAFEGGSWDGELLKDYEAYGVLANKEAEQYWYQGKPIAGFMDKGVILMVDGAQKEAGGIYVMVAREKDGGIKGILEISKEEFSDMSGLRIRE